MAAGVFDTAIKHGLKIPKDFRLAGMDGKHETYDNYSISTIRLDSVRQGALAAEKLIGIIEGKKEKFFEIQIKGSLLKRETM